MDTEYTVKALYELAQKRGIKYRYFYKKAELDKVLNVTFYSRPEEPPQPKTIQNGRTRQPVKLIHKKTGEIHNFPSMFSAAKWLGIA